MSKSAFCLSLISLLFIANTFAQDCNPNAGIQIDNPVVNVSNNQLYNVGVNGFQDFDGDRINGVTMDTVVIPDGTGEIYGSTITINETLPAGTVITKICIVIEHSFMRDLEIKITCPDSTEIILSESAGQTGGEIFLGTPFEDDEQQTPIPGVGSEYCWTSNATNGTWIEYANANNPFSLPAGNYQPFEDFSNLMNCPTNGAWTLSAQDTWAIDNGVIFSWSIHLQNGFQYQQKYFISEPTTENIVAQTDSSGIFNFIANPVPDGDYNVYAYNTKSNNEINNTSNIAELNCDPSVNCCELIQLAAISVMTPDPCDTQSPVSGCTIPEACGYNPSATCDDGSCIIVDCNQDCSFGDIATIDPNDSCNCIVETITVSGCTDTNATNYNPEANCDDGSCEVVTAVNELEKITFSIAPNPARSHLTIATPTNINYTIELYNIFGQLIFSGFNSTEIDLNGFLPGTYLVKIIDNEVIGVVGLRKVMVVE